MKKLILIILFSLFSNQAFALAVNLPKHLVAENTPLAPKDGRRIEIRVDNADLSKAECKSLIQAYTKKAGSEGQVSVHKPSPKWQNETLPWCVDNMDGKGVFFNDDFF